MTREELEAVVWEAVRQMRNCRTKGKCTLCNARVEDILAAADEYVTTEVGLLTPAERRRVLFEATS